MLSDTPAFEASARNSPDASRIPSVTGSIANPETTNDRRTKADVFDPIESDSEGFQARQQMFSARRLTLSKTPDKHSAIIGKHLRTSASKTQFKGPKSNGFLLTTSKNGKQCDTCELCRLLSSGKFSSSTMGEEATNGNSYRNGRSSHSWPKVTNSYERARAS